MYGHLLKAMFVTRNGFPFGRAELTFLIAKLIRGIRNM